MHVSAQTKLQLNTFQKVYRKKLDEAQHNAGRWKAEYYQMREQLYQQQAKRRLWNQLPAVVAGCVIGLCVKSPPVKQAAGWLLTRLQQVNPWPALRQKLQTAAKRNPPADSSSAAASREDSSTEPLPAAIAAAAAEAAKPAQGPDTPSTAVIAAPGGAPESALGEVPVGVPDEAAAADAPEDDQGDEVPLQSPSPHLIHQ
jgi:hypothetical protein